MQRPLLARLAGAAFAATLTMPSVAIAALPTTSTAVPPDREQPAAAVRSADALSELELGLIGGVVAIGGIAAVALFSRRRFSEDRVDQTLNIYEAREPASNRSAEHHADARWAGNGPAEPPSPAELPAPPAARVTLLPLAFLSPPPQAVGRHEAVVDTGPTLDNPYRTRAKRLRRARLLDKQEAVAAERAARRRAGEAVMRASSVSSFDRGDATPHGAMRRGSSSGR